MKEKIRCAACTHWDAKAQYCEKNETATGAEFYCERGVAKGSEKERAEKIRSHMEDMVRIGNRHGYLTKTRVSDSHRILTHEKTGEELEIELLEMT